MADNGQLRYVSILNTNLTGGGSGGVTNNYYSTIVSGGTTSFNITNSIVTGGTTNITSNVSSYSGPVISAGGSTQGSGTVVFGNSNGITFGLNAGTMTASFSGGAGGGAGTQFSGTNISGTVDTAGISLSVAAPGGGGGAAISAGAASQNTGTVIFSNASGVSFNLNAGTLIANVKTDYQTSGAYLTTAMASNAGSNFVGLNSALTGNGVSATINSSGVSLNVPAFLTTAALSNHSHSLNQIQNPAADVLFTFGQGRQIQFQFSNTGTFTTNANKQGLFEIDVQGNLVDGADAFHVHQSDNDPTIDLAHFEAWGTNVTAIRVSASASVGMEINKPIKWVGTAPNTASVPLILQAGMSNSVQYLNANFLQGSQASQFQSTGAYLTTAANSTHTHSQYLTTAQPPGAYLTTARASNDGIGLNTALTANGVAWTVNSSGLSLNVPAFLTTAAQSGHSHGNPTLNLTNLSGTTASASNGFTLSLSAAAPGGGGGAAISAAGGSQSTGTVIFSNSNGVSFGYNAGTITATVVPGAAAGIAAFQGSNATYTSGTVAMTGAGAITIGSDTGQKIVVSGPALTVLTAGANITLSSAGSTISIIGPSPGGGAAPNRSYIEIMNGERMTRPINVSATQFSNRPVFFPFWLDGAGLVPKTVRIFSSWITNTRFPNFTIGAAIYSLNNSTQLTLEQSTTQAWSVTGSGASASYSGIRAFDITGMTGSMGEGRKILGLYFSAGATSNMDASLYGGDAFPAVVGFLSGGTGTAATANTKHFFPFWGVLASSSAGFPNAVGATDINGGRSADVVDIYAVIKEI